MGQVWWSSRDVVALPNAPYRGAMLVRVNSLIRGHSGVRWELIEKIVEILRANITPVVPLRASISASGGALALFASFSQAA